MMNINKRGASHADWAISLGIFLLYILSMLMLIQPGVQPFYKEDELLNIVTENYKAETAFMFYKTPIVINTGGMELPVAANYKVDLNVQFPFTSEVNVNNYAMASEDRTTGEVRYMPLQNFEIRDGWGYVSFDAFIEPNKIHTFYIISNKKADGTSIEYIWEGIRGAPSGIPLISNTALPTANFTLTIGSTEILQGVSADLLAKDSDLMGINCQDTDANEEERKYGAIKLRWGFPRSKDFMVLYSNTASAQYNPTDYDPVENPDGNIIPVCRQELPYEQANVVVEEWATRIVDELGNTDDIRMVARVW